jgi:hypothetical protein
MRYYMSDVTYHAPGNRLTMSMARVNGTGNGTGHSNGNGHAKKS